MLGVSFAVSAHSRGTPHGFGTLSIVFGILAPVRELAIHDLVLQAFVQIPPQQVHLVDFVLHVRVLDHALLNSIHLASDSFRSNG